MTITRTPGKRCQVSHGDYKPGCRLCWLARYSDEHRQAWGIPGPAEMSPLAYEHFRKRVKKALPCIHEGPVLEFCQTCQGAKAEGRHVRDCEIHERCTRDVVSPNVAACARCANYKPDYGVNASPPGIRIEEGLTKGEGNAAINAGIIEFNNRILLAYRTGWAGALIHIADLTTDWRVIRTKTINGLTRAEANYGREDPRLFIHRDKLHVSYIGVQGRRGGVWTYQCYARLDDNLDVEQTFAPVSPEPHHWQKNWSFFSHDNDLYAVYRIAPHRILRFNTNGEIVDEIATPCTIQWTGGEMRGSAPPVRVGDEYWHFMHDRIVVAGLSIYRTGLYAFEARPPFRITRWIPEPVLVSDPNTNPGNYASVLFTCGAMRYGDEWVISSGIHDRWIELHILNHQDLLRRLTNV